MEHRYSFRARLHPVEGVSIPALTTSDHGPLNSDEQCVTVLNRAPSARIKLTCTAYQNKVRIALVDVEDVDSLVVHAELRINHYDASSGGPTITQISASSPSTTSSNKTITLSPDAFDPNVKVGEGQRTVSGMLTDSDGAVFFLEDQVYNCNPVPVCTSASASVTAGGNLRIKGFS
jgi:hypothetical protein